MADKRRIQPVLNRKRLYGADQPVRRGAVRPASHLETTLYVKIALLALAAAAFLGAAVIGVSPSPGPRMGMLISLPWDDLR
jgi:hypothetical protein